MEIISLAGNDRLRKSYTTNMIIARARISRNMLSLFLWNLGFMYLICRRRA